MVMIDKKLEAYNLTKINKLCSSLTLTDKQTSLGVKLKKIEKNMACSFLFQTSKSDML